MKRFLKNMIANWKKAERAGKARQASRRKSFRPGLESLEDRTVPTIIFDPLQSGVEGFSNSGVTMSPSQLGAVPVTGYGVLPAAAPYNPYALNSPKVYFIFAGLNWGTNASPSTAVNNMIADAQAMFSSSYLSGLEQYGSNGQATYAGMYIDQSFGDPTTWIRACRDSNGNIADITGNPVWWETNNILNQIPSNPLLSSWTQPSGSDARTSPIYVVVRYTNNGIGVGGGYGGDNNAGPSGIYTATYNGYTANPNVNVMDIYISSADQVDQFSWALSHELVERMSTGTGNLTSTGVSEVSPGGTQIADGEPEGNNAYKWRLKGSNGSAGPVVTSYWSVVDQAFVVPDGSRQNVLMDPIVNFSNGISKFVNLQQGNLSI
jgi:hypothetical protein